MQAPFPQLPRAVPTHVPPRSSLRWHTESRNPIPHDAPQRDQERVGGRPGQSLQRVRFQFRWPNGRSNPPTAPSKNHVSLFIGLQHRGRKSRKNCNSVVSKERGTQWPCGNPLIGLKQSSSSRSNSNGRRSTPLCPSSTESTNDHEPLFNWALRSRWTWESQGTSDNGLQSLWVQHPKRPNNSIHCGFITQYRICCVANAVRSTVSTARDLRERSHTNACTTLRGLGVPKQIGWLPEPFVHCQTS